MIEKFQEYYYKVYNYLQKYGIVISYIVISLILLLAICSCRSASKVVETVKYDSIYINKTDTLKIVDVKRDTLRSIDSVYFYQFVQGDTVRIFQREVSNNYSTTNNNYNQQESKTDTIYKDRDVITEKTITKEPSAWAKFVYMLKGSIFAVILLALLLLGIYLYRKFKK